MKRLTKIAFIFIIMILSCFCSQINKFLISNVNAVVIIFGDINLDNEIDVTDLQLLKRHIIAGSKTEWILTGEKFTRGDINIDDEIDVTDLLLLKKLVIDNMDKTDEIKTPPSVNIAFDKRSADTVSTITATLTINDNGGGINLSKCKWIFNNSSNAIGVDESNYTESINSETEEIVLRPITAGTYYLHVLTTDYRGNKQETISESIEISQFEETSLASVVEIGDYVNYKATNYSYTSQKGSGTIHGNGYGTQTFTTDVNMKWRVLSKDALTGEVILISERSIGLQEDEQQFKYSDAIGYLYHDEELHRICSIYGYGYGANTNLVTNAVVGDLVEGTSVVSITGSGARSITAEDINKITGFNVNTYSCTADGQTVNYNQEITHKSSIYYPTRLTVDGVSESKELRTERFMYYRYKPTNYLDTNSEIYKMLFNQIGSTNKEMYALATRYGYIAKYRSSYGGMAVWAEEVCADNGISMGDAVLGETNEFPIRPVVYLQNTLRTTGKDASGAWIIK